MVAGFGLGVDIVGQGGLYLMGIMWSFQIFHRCHAVEVETRMSWIESVARMGGDVQYRTGTLLV